MKQFACLALSASLVSFSAFAEKPTPLVPATPLAVDETAPVSSGIAVADTTALDISTITLFSSKDPSQAWLAEAWGDVYYQGKVQLSDLASGQSTFPLTTKSLPLALYDVVAAGGKKPVSLNKDANWLMQRVGMLEKLGFLHTAYDLLDAIPRSQMTSALGKKKMLYAASLDKWDKACETLAEFSQGDGQLVQIFCEAKIQGFDKAALKLSVLEEAGTPPPLWFIQLLEAMRYETPMRDLPPHQDPLTWAMVLSLGAEMLPKDTLTDAWLDAASMPQLLQLWHSNNADEMMMRLHARLNHFSYGHFEPGQPNSYGDERHALADHLFKRSKADDQMERAADGENTRPMWDKLADLLRKLEHATAYATLPNPAPILAANGGYEDAWLAVMRSYVLLDALGYKVKPAYWQTLGEFAEGKTTSLPQRYVAPNMLTFIDSMGDPSHRTDLILTTAGLLGTKEALREQPDILQASLLRALSGAGLDALARDLAAESIVSLLPRD